MRNGNRVEATLKFDAESGTRIAAFEDGITPRAIREMCGCRAARITYRDADGHGIRWRLCASGRLRSKAIGPGDR